MLPEKDRGNDLVISLDDITSKNVLTGYSFILYTITI
jgi:hypothetical protein